MKDSLARIQTVPTMSSAQLDALGARAWMDHETLVVRLNQVTDPILRGMVVAIADHLFGRHADG